ncbi:hypothetical protein LOK49_LG14G00951 [Camellia lanceoleosa]|uniref:Uncharacterized protein n=1 Tax=Camellia lanceoleosa TaxID=1840588 RepID=A0ACC0FBF7_9ERIC|nr:hypothetical protein LOK49_LG14G00951 [Camellia lanceoleosa]
MYLGSSSTGIGERGKVTPYLTFHIAILLNCTSWTGWSRSHGCYYERGTSWRFCPRQCGVRIWTVLEYGINEGSMPLLLQALQQRMLNLSWARTSNN